MLASKLSSKLQLEPLSSLWIALRRSLEYCLLTPLNASYLLERPSALILLLRQVKPKSAPSHGNST